MSDIAEAIKKIVVEHLDVDADAALRLANTKFERRFERLRQVLGQQGMSLASASSSAMEDAWEQAKREETT